jgi:hypothetical protein
MKACILHVICVHSQILCISSPHLFIANLPHVLDYDPIQATSALICILRSKYANLHSVMYDRLSEKQRGPYVFDEF